VTIHVCFKKLICDADLKIINCVAKLLGSVRDARVLRESAIFSAFESNRKPLSGFIIGDSGYMTSKGAIHG